MTDQTPDTCRFDGRLWAIDFWDGPDDCIPNNDMLGIETVVASSANWAGRIDHFLVHKDWLFLFKVQATLAHDGNNNLPPNARKEVLSIYEPVVSTDGRGIARHDYTYFVFDGLEIDFTGKLQLSYPVYDPWNLPWPLDDDDFEVQKKAVLVFENGLLVDTDTYDS